MWWLWSCIVGVQRQWWLWWYGVVAVWYSHLITTSVALDNGVARTPPMGWMNWERYMCNVDCHTYPNDCVSEKLFMRMADELVSGGYKDAGYEYVCIDDCWLADHRDSAGRLQANTTRFPSGIRALADYMHARGLKLGMYQDVGPQTCAQYPGSYGHLQQDAHTFAEWGVDMLKLDGCYGNKTIYNEGYPSMGKYLNQTGRHIVYSCEWPMYMRVIGEKPDQELIAATCNMFRQHTDVVDSWTSVVDMIQFFGNDTDHFSDVAAPGAWNDPDQLVIGDYGLSYNQERAQMVMWAILAAPLIMSVDLVNINPHSKELLLHKGLIDINQDKLGIQGKRVKDMWQYSHVSVWTRPVTPQGSFAIALLNTRYEGGPVRVTLPLHEVGLVDKRGYEVVEVFTNTPMGRYTSDMSVVCEVNPSGVYVMRATVVTATAHAQQHHGVNVVNSGEVWEKPKA